MGPERYTQVDVTLSTESDDTYCAKLQTLDIIIIMAFIIMMVIVVVTLMVNLLVTIQDVLANHCRPSANGKRARKCCCCDAPAAAPSKHMSSVHGDQLLSSKHMSSVNSTQHMSSVNTGKHNPLLQNVDSQLLSPSMHTGLCPHMLQYILHALYTEYELHCRCSVDCNDLRCSQDTASFQAKSYVTTKSCIM